MGKVSAPGWFVAAAVVMGSLGAPDFAVARDQAAEPATSGSLTLKVHTPDGKPVEEFQLWMRRVDSWQSNQKFLDGRGGTAELRAEDVAPPPNAGKNLRKFGTTASLELVVQAPGFAPAILPIRQPTGHEETSVTLEQGRQIELILRPPSGVKIPVGLRPALFFPDQASLVSSSLTESLPPSFKRPERPFTFPLMEEKTPGHYLFRWAGPEENLSLLVNHPGFLRAFIHPVPREEMVAGKITVELPKAAGLNARFTARAGESLPDTTTSLDISSMFRVPGEDMYYLFTPYRKLGQGQELSIEAADLAPGRYNVQAATGGAYGYPSSMEKQRFQERKRIQLAAGETTGPVTVEFVPYDESKYRGDYAVDVKLSRSGGAPLDESTSYSLSVYDDVYSWITVAEGLTPTTGPLQLTGLPGGERATTMTLDVGGETAGQVYLPGPEKRRPLEFKLPPMKGDVAPEIRMTDVLTSRPMRLSDYKGQVVFVDFWATWCGPCQEPMAHNQKIMTERADAWKGKAVILGCSIDEEMETVTGHVKKNNWTALPQGWASGGEAGWKSQAAKEYGVSGVPTAVLIDQNGRIVRRGHPASFEIEKEIEALLK